jgi:DNA-binding response OmpR family regulator
MSTATRTLIVDDDPDVHSLLAAALAAPDRQIDSAYDGLAGLRMIEESHYDAVWTWLRFPSGGGFPRER